MDTQGTQEARTEAVQAGTKVGTAFGVAPETATQFKMRADDVIWRYRAGEEISKEDRRLVREADEWRALPVWARRLYLTAKRSARARDIEFRLTHRDFVLLVRRAKGACQITGLPFDFERGTGFRRPFAPSVDRVSSARTYTFSNCRLVCVAANAAMNEWGEEILAKMARAYVAKNGP